MKLVWSEGAHSDWDGIARYIGINFGKKAFDEFDEATDKAEAQIKEFPDSGTSIKTRKHKNLGLKYVFIGKARLSKMIYHIDGDTVIIDVIWDTRQSPKRLAQRLAKM